MALSWNQKCAGHRSDGSPCRAWSVRGLATCIAHGSATGRARKKGELVMARLAATRRLAGLDIEPLEDPFDQLERVLAQSVEFLTIAKQRMEAAGAETDVKLFLDALKATFSHLAEWQRLGFAERKVRARELRTMAETAELRRAFDAVLTDPAVGLSDEQKAALTVAVVRELPLTDAERAANPVTTP